jgi:RNA polymerase sigma factor (sigma-70 family)
MTRRSSGAVLRQIHTLFTAGSSHGLSDQQLLERFVARRDAVAELAFATLVERHGAMVLGVCRRILADSHDAEDAFQATFLVLVRQARSIRVDGSLGRWLYGVATRVSAHARANARRRQARERLGRSLVDVESRDTSTVATVQADIQKILAEELDRLPDRFKAPIVLCDLEGTTHEDAARFLGCPVGTIKSRLSRARARLRRGLIRRGLASPDLATIIPLIPVAVPPRLAEATNQAAQIWILGRLPTASMVSASVITLTEGVLWTMVLAKLKFAAAAVLLVAVGTAVLVSQATAQKPLVQEGAAEKSGITIVSAEKAVNADDAIDLDMLERAWVDALNRKNAAVVGRIIADDFVCIDSAGNRSNRELYLASIRIGDIPGESISQQEIKVQLFDASAVVTSRIARESKQGSHGSLNVYVKRQNRWRCVASQASWIGADNSMRQLRLTKGQEESERKQREQLVAQVSELQGMLNLAEARNALLTVDLMQDRAKVQSNQPGGARSTNVAKSASGQPASGARKSNVDPVDPVDKLGSQRLEQVKIRPRLECLVEKIYVRAGETVKKGAALVDLYSTDLAAAKNDYLTKEVQLKHHQRILGLRRKLFEHEAISEQVWTDAQNNEEKSKLEFQVARDKLKMLGLDDEAIGLVAKEDGDRKARVTLRAPVDGTVTQVDVVLGNLYDLNDVLMILSATSSAPSTQH